MIKGKVEFGGQNNRNGHQQPNASGRKISYSASDEGVLIKQDHACQGTKVPPGSPAFNTSVFRRRAIRDEAIGLELRQMQPSLSLKCVQSLDARVLCPKCEPNAVQRLSLKPLCFQGLCHLPRACHRSMPGQTHIKQPEYFIVDNLEKPGAYMIAEGVGIAHIAAQRVDDGDVRSPSMDPHGRL
jgi:hypothetical protein